MKEILDRIVTEEHLVWNNTLSEKKEEFVVDLDPGIIEDEDGNETYRPVEIISVEVSE